MAGRFDNVANEAAELCEPEVQFMRVPRRTLKTEDDVDTWAKEVTQKLKEAIKQGPVSLS
jgi:hypothetical protein